MNECVRFQDANVLLFWSYFWYNCDSAHPKQLETFLSAWIFIFYVRSIDRGPSIYRDWPKFVGKNPSKQFLNFFTTFLSLESEARFS